jgi:hypothetical protein
VVLSVEISPAAQGLIEHLMRNTGAASYGALFNDALTLMNWAVQQRQDGRIIASINEANGRFKELQMLPLENAANKIVDLQAEAEAEQAGPELVTRLPLARAGGV